MRPAARNTIRHSAMIAAMMPIRIATRTGSPSARPASSTVAVIAPGPAISGMASGNAAMLRTCSSSALLGGLGLTRDAQPEHHFGRDREQQQSAGDAERRKRDRHHAQQPVADQRGAGQDRERDQAGAQRDLTARAARQAGGERR